MLKFKNDGKTRLGLVQELFDSIDACIKSKEGEETSEVIVPLKEQVTPIITTFATGNKITQMSPENFLPARKSNTATPAPLTRQVTDEATNLPKKAPEKEKSWATVAQKAANLPTPAVPQIERNMNRKNKPSIPLAPSKEESRILLRLDREH
ncbi:hypothetical protein BGT96224_Ac30093 [Blumeria graminis f. sp. tritici 96224]|uniref:Uncharacterized protein n=1 Tax=Blumeria graminis f. sp. tritici 96224 TaxID=1268274 RepID=A0A656KN39_BLUGR|nr:hypothetical protein BGT96224_Ac30093 [Blumeria graminis f. sp. tritici 96224]